MGGSSNQTIGYHYKWLLGFGWCRGPIDALLELRGGDAPFFQGRVTSSSSITINKPDLWGGEKGEGGVTGTWDLCFGEQTQLPNDYLVSTLGPQQSAHRGKFTTVARGGRFGAFYPNPKPVSAKVERILADWQGGAAWYPAKAVINLLQVASSDQLGDTSNGWSYLQVASTDTADYSAAMVDTSSWSIGQMPFANVAGHPYAAGAGYPAIENTYWALNTNLWLRRSFMVYSVEDMIMEVFIDNYATVWVNGVNVLPRAGTINGASSAAFLHQFTVPASLLMLGENTVAMLCEDFGTYSYAAFKIITNGTQVLNAMNPAHVLYDSVVHDELQGDPVGLINDASFRAAADQLYAEGFGICTSYDSSAETPAQFQQRICNLIGGCLTQSRIDGLYYLDLIRTVADPSTLPIITEDDVKSFKQTPGVVSELINLMRVEWFDPQAKQIRTTQPIYSAGAIQSAGSINADSRTFHELPSESLALRVCKRELVANSSAPSKFELKLLHRFRSLRPGQSARLQMPSEGIADMVIVVGQIEHGTLTNSGESVVALQNVYNMPDAVYAQPQTSLWTDPDTAPVASPSPLAFEAPYIDLAATLSNADLAALPADVGYLATLATRPTSGINYELDTAANAEAYVAYGSGDWAPTLIINEAATEALTSFTFTAGQDLSRLTEGSWALWDGEIVRVDAFDEIAGTVTLGRGCADTPPIPHAAAARLVGGGEWLASDRREYVGGDVVHAKLLTRTASALLDITTTTAIDVAMNDRQVRPYAPGNLTVQGARYPAAVQGSLVLAWSHRDRVLSADQLVDTLQPDIGPEAGTTYTVVVYLNGVVDSTASGITATTLTPTVSGDGTVRVEISAQRAGYNSWMPLSATFDYARDARVTSAGDLRVTTTGDVRAVR